MAPLYDARGVVHEERCARLPGSTTARVHSPLRRSPPTSRAAEQIVEAVRLAQAFTWAALDARVRPGGGQHIPWRAP